MLKVAACRRSAEGSSLTGIGLSLPTQAEQLERDAAHAAVVAALRQQLADAAAELEASHTERQREKEEAQA